MSTFFYDPKEESVRARCHVIELYTQANELRHSPHQFLLARKEAENAAESWSAKYGPTLTRKIAATSSIRSDD